MAAAAIFTEAAALAAAVFTGAAVFTRARGWDHGFRNYGYGHGGGYNGYGGYYGNGGYNACAANPFFLLGVYPYSC